MNSEIMKNFDKDRNLLFTMLEFLEDVGFHKSFVMLWDPSGVASYNFVDQLDLFCS